MTDELGPTRRAVSELWDEVAEEFLKGGTVPSQLKPWAASYSGTGKAAVQLDALPELFLGPLGKPKGVFLALNPGEADLSFHGRSGIFSKEIRQDYGSYSAWAESWPYCRDPWITEKKPNRHHKSRLRFLRDWCGNQELTSSAMVSFELYPWHSSRFTSDRFASEDAHKFIEDYVWKPVRELGAPVFAFGTPWFSILQNLDLKVVKRLGVSGQQYGSRVKSRSVIVLQESGRGGVTVLAEKHRGSAGPPSSKETELLREAVGDLCS